MATSIISANNDNPTEIPVGFLNPAEPYDIDGTLLIYSRTFDNNELSLKLYCDPNGENIEENIASHVEEWEILNADNIRRAKRSLQAFAECVQAAEQAFQWANLHAKDLIA